MTTTKSRASKAGVLPVGSELWLLYFDQVENRYTTKSLGKITGYERGRGYYVKGHGWVVTGFPHFGSKAEADGYIAEHPFTAPTIS